MNRITVNPELSVFCTGLSIYTIQYYKEALNVPGKDYFWRQALDIQMVLPVVQKLASGAGIMATIKNSGQYRWVMDLLSLKKWLPNY